MNIKISNIIIFLSVVLIFFSIGQEMKIISQSENNFSKVNEIYNE